MKISNAEREMLILAAQKRLMGTQGRFYSSYRAAIDARVIQGIPEDEAKLIADEAVKRNQEELERQFEAQRPRIMKDVEALIQVIFGQKSADESGQKEKASEKGATTPDIDANSKNQSNDTPEREESQPKKEV